MFDFKNPQRERVQETREQAKRTAELGAQIAEQGERTNELLKSIEVQDSEDQSGIDTAIDGYGDSYNTAFDTQVEQPKDEIVEKDAVIETEVNNEITHVDDGIDKMRQAEGVSDIGSDVASEGGSRLESSKQEYEGIVSDAQENANEIEERVNTLINHVHSLF